MPDKETWLYENPKVMNLVLQGIEEAKQGKFATPPDIESDANLEIMLDN